MGVENVLHEQAQNGLCAAWLVPMIVQTCFMRIAECHASFLRYRTVKMGKRNQRAYALELASKSIYFGERAAK